MSLHDPNWHEWLWQVLFNYLRGKHIRANYYAGGYWGCICPHCAWSLKYIEGIGHDEWPDRKD